MNTQMVLQSYRISIESVSCKPIPSITSSLQPQNFCLDHGKLVCIENPRSSLYWKTTFFQPLVNRLKFTAHQACAYGSSRPKWTALAHNTTTLLKFNHVCPGIGALHKHKPWGVVNGPAGRKFSTAEETAYPLALAYRIAYSLAQETGFAGLESSTGCLLPPRRSLIPVSSLGSWCSAQIQ